MLMLLVLPLAPALAADAATTEFAWTQTLSAIVMLISGLAIWLVARYQTRRIRELKREAEKLREADFGKPLGFHRGELGELAAVFNDMREKLKATTISRDYLDSILASMNDAIVVTSEDGTIKRVNKATVHLLGYEEEELIGMSIDYVVNSRKTGSLIAEQPSGLPREAFFDSKFGESIPISYTCSFLGGKEAESGDQIGRAHV